MVNKVVYISASERLAMAAADFSDGSSILAFHCDLRNGADECLQLCHGE
jgi:hypothetical protein